MTTHGPRWLGGHCEKCFQIALVTVAAGLSPTGVGVDPVEVLCALPIGGWTPSRRTAAPADLHPGLRSILDQHFRPGAEPEFAGILKRSRELLDWITAPLIAPGG